MWTIKSGKIWIRSHYPYQNIKYKKKKKPNQIETQNTENQNAAHPSTTKQMLSQEDKINLRFVKKIVT